MLPSARSFAGVLGIRNENPFVMQAQFFGDPEWTSSLDIPASTRIFIYSKVLA